MEKFQCRRGRLCTCLTSRTQHWSDGIEKDATPSSSALTNMAKLGMHKWRLSVRAAPVAIVRPAPTQGPHTALNVVIAITQTHIHVNTPTRTKPRREDNTRPKNEVPKGDTCRQRAEKQPIREDRRDPNMTSGAGARPPTWAVSGEHTFTFTHIQSHHVNCPYACVLNLKQDHT